jgi:hypothetical protein
VSERQRFVTNRAAASITRDCLATTKSRHDQNTFICLPPSHAMVKPESCASGVVPGVHQDVTRNGVGQPTAFISAAVACP